MTVRYLILMLTQECNLNCAYCYHESSITGPSMHKDMVDAAVREMSPHGPSHIQLSGGEPSLVPHLIEYAAKTARNLSPHSTLGIQTNGTILDPALVKLFKRFNVQVGISLDGPMDIQEQLRGNAASTLKGLKLLEEANVPFRVTSVITNKNIAYLDRLVLMLSSFPNARGIGLDLLIHKGSAVTSDAVLPASPGQMTDGINRMMDALRMVNRNRRIKLEFRELNAVTNAVKRKPGACFCHVGAGESLAVCPDGSLYPCSQTAGDSRFFLGTFSEPDSAPARLLSTFRLSSANCGHCPLKRRCPGDCYSRQYYNDAENRQLICEMYKAIWNYESSLRTRSVSLHPFYEKTGHLHS